MPELPEVETIRRGLVQLRGKQIAAVVVRVPKMVAPPDFSRRLKNKTISGVARRGKMLIVELDAATSFLLIHLKMTGQLVYQPKKGKLIVGGHPIVNVEEVPNRFTHIEFHFKDSSVLYFNDVRKFGWCRLVDEKGLLQATEHYGPEPLERSLSLKVWLALLEKKKRMSVKKALLDQTVIAGIGNIYVDEACFYTGIRPDRIISTLTEQERVSLLKNLRKVLRLSIKQGGTSFHTYRTVHGTRGGFHRFLKVYGKKEVMYKGKLFPVTKIKHAGRGTHYCDKCQR